MELNRKKILLLPLNILTDGEGLTDFHIKRKLLDRIRQMNISRVAIIIEESKDKDYVSKIKSIEFFVFTYCKTAVSSHYRSDMMIEEITRMMPHNQRKAEFFLSIGEKIEGIDFISLEDYIA